MSYNETAGNMFNALQMLSTESKKTHAITEAAACLYEACGGVCPSDDPEVVEAWEDMAAQLRPWMREQGW